MLIHLLYMYMYEIMIIVIFFIILVYLTAHQHISGHTAPMIYQENKFSERIALRIETRTSLATTKVYQSVNIGDVAEE